MSLVSLNCLVLGDGPERIFTVNIDPSETVSNLRTLIKENLSPRFDDIAANTLVLWPVSLLDDDNITEAISSLDFKNMKTARSTRRVDSVFSNLLQDHLHVIVKGPVSLNCLVLGDGPERIFTVNIDPSETVNNFRALITKNLSPRLNDIPVNTLRLSKVSILVDEEFAQSVSIAVPMPLKPLDVISSVFDTLQAGHVHVIIELPQNKDDTLLDLPILQTYKNTLKKIRGALPPSKSASTVSYREYQHEMPIYDGRFDFLRPIPTMAPPVQLFHPAFAHFLDDIEKEGDIPNDALRAAVEYMHTASPLYDLESSRKSTTLDSLENAIHPWITHVNRDNTSPDKIILVQLIKPQNKAAVLIEENERELGDGSSDPSTQVGLSMSRFWAEIDNVIRNHSCCPTFLLATAGPWFTVLGAVFTDKVVVQRLTDFVWAGFSSTLNEPQCFRVARILYALKQNVGKLAEYYRGLDLDLKRDDVHPLHTRFFPSITAFREDASQKVIEFAYSRALEKDSTCVTFLAETIEESPKRIVVKFVERYGEAAHRLLASREMAPQLFYYGPVGVNAGDPTYGHLKMVVMEYLDGKTLYELYVNGKRPWTFRDDVKNALDILHENGMVFGDLRDVNVMVMNDGVIKLIDFDWAGKEGTVRYPLLMSKNIKWADDVQVNDLIEQKHDLEMLKMIL